MSKIKRNDPCDCGSGKKYKKCCMNKNDHGGGSVSLHEELKNYYSHFMAYVNRNFPNLIPAEKKESQEEEIEAAFWMVQSVFMEKQKGGKTIYEEFLDKKREKITRPATLASLESWKSPIVGLFKFQSGTAQTAMMADVWSKETYEVNCNGIPLKEENYAQMPYCIGVLLKWGPVYNFVPLAIPNYEAFYNSFQKQLAKEFADTAHSYMGDYMQETLIEQLRKWMGINSPKPLEPSEGTETEDDEVLEQLGAQLNTNLKGSDSYEKLRKSWALYRKEQQPTFRKPAVVAAALEHIYRGTSYFGANSEKVTKKEVASKYEVSPSSMSQRISQLTAFFDSNSI